MKSSDYDSKYSILSDIENQISIDREDKDILKIGLLDKSHTVRSKCSSLVLKFKVTTLWKELSDAYFKESTKVPKDKIRYDLIELLEQLIGSEIELHPDYLEALYTDKNTDLKNTALKLIKAYATTKNLTQSSIDYYLKNRTRMCLVGNEMYTLPFDSITKAPKMQITGKVVQIIDKQTILYANLSNNKLFVVKDTNAIALVDGLKINYVDPCVVIGNYSYTTVQGSNKTVLVITAAKLFTKPLSLKDFVNTDNKLMPTFNR